MASPVQALPLSIPWWTVPLLLVLIPAVNLYERLQRTRAP